MAHRAESKIPKTHYKAKLEQVPQNVLECLQSSDTKYHKLHTRREN